MMSNSAGPAIRGGASCTTGCTRSSTRAMSPSSSNFGTRKPRNRASVSSRVNGSWVSSVLHELEGPEVTRTAEVANDGKRRDLGEPIVECVLVRAHVGEDVFAVEQREVLERDRAAHRMTAEGEAVRERRGSFEEGRGEEVATNHCAEW